jgi:CheY-like chemotaxis protein
MITFKSGKLLVVAPATSSIPIPAKKQVVHITNPNRIFPVIHQQQPNAIMLDHELLGDNMEKVLRRLTANPFYHKIKIYCYKAKSNTKADDLLQTLGVQYFIYAEDAKQPIQKNATVKALSELLEARMISTLAEASY